MSTLKLIFASRKVWVAIGALILSLAAALGLSQEKIIPIITAIVTLAGVVIAAIGYEDGSAKQAGQQIGQPPSTTPPSNPPNTPAAALLLCGLIAMALGTSGCQTSPLQRAVAAREVYTSTLNVLADARQLGQISDSDARQLEGYRQQAAVALELMEQSAVAGDSGFAAKADAFTAAMETLLRWRIQVQSQAANPKTTQPARSP